MIGMVLFLNYEKYEKLEPTPLPWASFYPSCWGRLCGASCFDFAGEGEGGDGGEGDFLYEVQHDWGQLPDGHVMVTLRTG